MNDPADNARQLEQEATDLLRSRGFTWSGRPTNEVDTDQAHFERRAVRTPTNGDPTKRRRRKS